MAKLFTMCSTHPPRLIDPLSPYVAAVIND